MRKTLSIIALILFAREQALAGKSHVPSMKWHVLQATYERQDWAADSLLEDGT